MVDRPPPLVDARVGRDHQRYDEKQRRLICGCVPFRTDHDGSIEVLVISGKGGNGWILPKGGWDDDESAEQCAVRELEEEAGVRGDLITDIHLPPASAFSKKKNEWQCIQFFALLVTEMLDTWPEHASRDRQWVKLGDLDHRIPLKHKYQSCILQSFRSIMLPAHSS